MTRRTALLTAVLVGSLVACSDDRAPASPSGPVAATASPDPVPTPSSRPSTAVSPSGPAEPDAPEAFPADVRVDVAEASAGGPLTVRAVRVAPQEGYDRVVFELAGRHPGQAGWRVEYVDRPTAQGSGDPVQVEGEAVLAVLLTGTGYPMDTGVEEVAEDPALPGGLAVVSDVVLGAVFEGQYEAFLGTTGRRPFRVFRLADPERVVVDVRVS